jgi:uncharacterized protein (DUF1697 family)
MNAYVVLIRGINVGGKNIIPMAGLRKALEERGFSEVSTYIASGNVLLKSDKKAGAVQSQIEKIIPKNFKVDDPVVRVLVLTHDQLKNIVRSKPKGFGEQPGKYHSDAIFLMGLDASTVLAEFNPREGVDTIRPGDGVIYSQRLSAQRTKSRLSKIMGSPSYKSMTIRNWNTVTKLQEMMNKMV